MKKTTALTFPTKIVYDSGTRANCLTKSITFFSSLFSCFLFLLFSFSFSLSGLLVLSFSVSRFLSIYLLFSLSLFFQREKRALSLSHSKLKAVDAFIFSSLCQTQTQTLTFRRKTFELRFYGHE